MIEIRPKFQHPNEMYYMLQETFLGKCCRDNSQREHKFSIAQCNRPNEMKFEYTIQLCSIVICLTKYAFAKPTHIKCVIIVY